MSKSVLHLNKLSVPEKEKIDHREGEPDNSAIIEAESKIVPVGFENEKEVEDFVLKRDKWGMFRIVNRSNKGSVPKIMRGSYSESAAQGIISAYVNKSKVKIED